MTFGRLLTVARQRVDLPTETEALIRTALITRNRLIHRFFGDHSEDFISAMGRRAMALELRDAVVLFRRADEASERISSQLFSNVGVSRAAVESELEAMTRARRFVTTKSGMMASQMSADACNAWSAR